MISGCVPTTTRLTAEEHKRFAEDGFVILPDRFSPEEISPLRRAFNRLAEITKGLSTTTTVGDTTFVLGTTETSQRAVHRVVWCGGIEPELLAVSTDSRVIGPALDILSANTCDQLVNQAHFKQPLDGVEFPFHQDAWNRRWGTALWRDRSADGGYVQILLTLDTMSEENGPLLVVPGSHKLGPILGFDRHRKVDAYIQTRPVRALIAAPGTLILFGPFLIHGSRPNQSTNSRRVLVNGFARSGVNRRRYPGSGLGLRRTHHLIAENRG